MLEFLYEYGLFLAKAITIVVALVVVIGTIAGAAMKNKPAKGQLEIQSLSQQVKDAVDYAQHTLLDKKAYKAYQKKQKKESEQHKNKKRLFVIDFKGSMDAHEVDMLKEEVNAVLCVAQEDDEVLVKIESGGGVVHGYGLAASQLQRFKDKNIKLVAAVDKVAASGGYMMACVADKIIAAPFAIIGSIGVIAQLPNFHRLLDKNNIDFEQHTAGEYKRTLTIFGENTDEGRDKFREELNQVHNLFKTHVSSHRQDVDIDKVATGEYWHGHQALELKLVDELATSDDYLLSALNEKELFSVRYSLRKNVAEKLGIAAATGFEKGLMSLWSKLSFWSK